MKPNYRLEKATLGAIALLLSVISAQPDASGDKIGQLSQSAWRKINVFPKSLEGSQRPSEFYKVARGRNFIEWDDDELNDSKLTKQRPQPDSSKVELRDRAASYSERDFDQSKLIKSRDTKSRFNRLIFHGQLKSNETVRTNDGLRFKINIHQPVSIIRASSSRTKDLLDRYDRAKYLVDDEESSETSRQSLPDTAPRLASAKGANSQDVTSLAGSGSDWRPIIQSTTKLNKSGKQMVTVVKPTLKRSVNKTERLMTTLSSRWTPVSKENKLRVHYATEKDYTTTSSSIDEPFEDAGLVTARFGDSTSSHWSHEQRNERRESKSMGTKRSLNNGWKPVDQVTTPASELTTTTNVPTTITAGLHNSSEPAQRSASDLNYIYSQAQQPNQLVDGSRQPYSGGSYYSTYLTPPVSQPQTLVEQPQQQAIVDTTSGQTPETVADRQPEVPLSMMDYSSQITSNVQQPIRSPNYASYDTQTGYSSPRVQPPTQAVRQIQPQVVRQEHHYHYYNSPSPQRQQSQFDTSPERSQTSQVVSQQPNIVREIQPILISQPIVQQQPPVTSSPAPSSQIIREIIKEVPVIQQLPIPVPRIIAPQPPIAIPLSPASRELEPVYSYSGPAQRIMKQLTNSVPSVSFRAVLSPPVTPQVRLTVPTIQLPVRLTPTANLAPVTRQTGSFLIPPVPKKTTTYLTETQAMPTHTTIMQTTQFTPATRTTVFTTDHQATRALATSTGYKRK